MSLLGKMHGMPTIEKNIFLIFKVFLIIGGAILVAYSWVSTLYGLPFLIKDWRWGLGLGLVLFMGGMGWVILDLYRRYVWWAEPVIVLTSNNDDEHIGGRFVNCSNLKVYNDEETEITDCQATLVLATNLYGGTLDPVNIVEKGYLLWKENRDCSIVIPPKDERTVKVADNRNGFRFSFCKPSHFGTDLMGLYSPITIRIDGKLNGRNIKPQFFSGYLYVNNYLGESGEFTTTTTDANGKITKSVTPSHPEVYTTLIFEKGNWMSDKRLSMLNAAPKKE